MAGSLTLLVTSPRTPAGVLTRDAWRALDTADLVLAADADHPTPAAIAGSGVAVEISDPSSMPLLGRSLAEAAADRHVVWIVSPDGDPGLTDALAAELTRAADPAPVEMLVGSWDLPGARLADAVNVMDVLRSPGGCPWDAKQTHESLAKYLLEEAHETVEAIDNGDRDHLREELGDVLLQVLFHARVAADDPDDPWDIDDVAGGLVDKLLRRHPHVFGDGDASTPEEVEASWEQIKAAEKADRAESATPLLEGIPRSLSTLLIADKVLARRERSGLTELPDDKTDADNSGADLGDRLLALVAEGRRTGVDADAALRDAVRRLASA
ncbi:MazG family protein [Calidifontibacter indicus]|uniref:XTP/dITP diphosphohydrolase n=1 Tax=Calidifontibacter indicus TaxID=419650 RepID=A0A3D9ULF2_9MICO|nr:MazG family protein [Calidifontibacter indicus]REF30272.1 XTP/dITP diphosphohydrolase [Calidifontibacter indicus]